MKTRVFKTAGRLFVIGAKICFWISGHDFIPFLEQKPMMKKDKEKFHSSPNS